MSNNVSADFAASPALAASARTVAAPATTAATKISLAPVPLATVQAAQVVSAPADAPPTLAAVPLAVVAVPLTASTIAQAALAPTSAPAASFSAPLPVCVVPEAAPTSPPLAPVPTVTLPGLICPASIPEQAFGFLPRPVQDPTIATFEARRSAIASQWREDKLRAQAFVEMLSREGVQTVPRLAERWQQTQHVYFRSGEKPSRPSTTTITDRGDNRYRANGCSSRGSNKYRAHDGSMA